jgi:hypothetical protein
VTADKALLFEPASTNTRKLLDTLVPRLQVSFVTISTWQVLLAACGSLCACHKHVKVPWRITQPYSNYNHADSYVLYTSNAMTAVAGCSCSRQIADQ